MDTLVYYEPGLWVYSKNSIPYSAQFSRDGNYIVTASGDSTAAVWNVSSGKKTAELKGHHHAVWMGEFSGDGKKVVTASWDSTARIWDAQTGKMIVDFRGHSAAMWYLKFCPTPKRLSLRQRIKQPEYGMVATGLQLTNMAHLGNGWSASFIYLFVTLYSYLICNTIALIIRPSFYLLSCVTSSIAIFLYFPGFSFLITSFNNFLDFFKSPSFK